MVLLGLEPRTLVSKTRMISISLQDREIISTIFLKKFKHTYKTLKFYRCVFDVLIFDYRLLYLAASFDPLVALPFV